MVHDSYNVKDAEWEEIVKRGEYMTVLETDTRYSEHRPIVILVSKRGSKYIHGLVCHRDEAEGVRPNYWVAKIDKENARVFEGQRWDMIDQYYEYLNAKNKHKADRDRFYQVTWSDLESELRDRHAQIMKGYDLKNPEPKDPFAEGS